MGCSRRMEKIKWSKKVTNEVLECMREKRTLLFKILHIQASWISHIQRRNWLLHNAIDAQIK